MCKKKVVTIGGGTGSFMLLSGLKEYPIDLSAIVSMADDGGSTGVLRDELGVLPPGDVRQCLVALSESPQTLRDLMNYRFERGGLKGHSFGNIFLSAFEKVTGSFDKGVKEVGRVLKIRGEVIPVTALDVNLYMELKDGSILQGEDEINKCARLQKIGILKNYLRPHAKASKRAIRKILEADLVVIGPGNHYCSIIPNFLVGGISRAIIRSRARVVYNCNLVNKKGHTSGYSLGDYASDINHIIGQDRIDYVIFNNRKPSQKLIEKYNRKREMLVENCSSKNKKYPYRVIEANVLSNVTPKYSKSDVLAGQRAFIRHDSQKLARVLMKLI
ncbi:uridine diphosphate-N-acetylglucosamine-binding protein YvcK [Patescibacteria group bacterium]|nr:uridine diphosphate-N-acetylglucosamine-binding protein YvcK [Patescibacteria group bacterium]